jgi:hypothetical protein
MAGWRRLCIDVDDSGRVLGASIEHYDDRKVDPRSIGVLARREWDGVEPQELLERLLYRDGFQPAFGFGLVPDPPSY